MILINHFLTKKHRLVDYKNIKPKKFSEEDNGYTFQFMVFSESSQLYYTSIIWFSSKNFTPSTQIKVRCDCKSFIFQYQSILFQRKGLYGSDHIIKKMPKKLEFGMCKHLLTCLSYSMYYKNVNKLKKQFGVTDDD